MSLLNLSHLQLVLLAFFSAIIVTLIFIPVIVQVATIHKLTDKPGYRKVHHCEIPVLGGVGIFAGFSVGFLMTSNWYLEGAPYFMIGIIVLFFAGLHDDLVKTSPLKKISLQICSALIIAVLGGIRITSFHGFLGIYLLPDIVSYLTTIFLVVLIINSLNLIDGIDGLAAVTGIIESSVLGYWLYRSGDIGFALIAASLIGTLGVFLVFNLSSGRNKIFMGDTGSMVTGLIIAVMVIRFNEINAAGTSFYVLKSAPAVSIGIMIVPLFDTLRVIIIRVIRGQSPFIADKRHIHHMFLRAGFSHRRSTCLIACGNVLVITTGFVLDYIGILWLACVLALICLLLTLPVYYLVARKEGWQLRIKQLYQFTRWLERI